jgi:rhizosphere induced protein
MTMNVPVGGICLYPGKVADVSDTANPVWPPKTEVISEPSFPLDTSGVMANGAVALLEPLGWMVCDGRQLFVSAFYELYAALGNLYGGDPASGTFRIPDLRGVFVRGVDNGAGADPDANKRRSPDDKEDYAGVGSMQLDALQTHQHDYKEPTGTTISDKGSAAFSVPPDTLKTSDPLPPARVSKDETRARNIAVYYIIRYR